MFGPTAASPSESSATNVHLGWWTLSLRLQAGPAPPVRVRVSIADDGHPLPLVAGIGLSSRVQKQPTIAYGLEKGGA
jgi:hypothetical protein